VVTDDLLATTSSLAPCGECFPPLAANSQFPDPTVAAIIVNPARFAVFGAPLRFTGFGLQACTLPVDDSAAIIGGGGGDSRCPQPTLPQGE
jgi:hypothetical protein